MGLQLAEGDVAQLLERLQLHMEQQKLQTEKSILEFSRAVAKLNALVKDVNLLIHHPPPAVAGKKSSPGKKRGDKKRAAVRSGTDNDGDEEKHRASTGEMSSNETDSSHAVSDGTPPQQRKGRRGDRRSRRQRRRSKRSSESRAANTASGLSTESLVPTWTGAEVRTFAELPLSAALLQGLLASPAGDGKPTHYQSVVLPALMTDADIVVQANGVGADEGKLTAVAVAALHKVRPALKQCQVLLLTASREAAKLLHRELLALSAFIRPRLTVHLSIGGTSIRDDLRDMCAGCHVVVGTLGRAFDMLRRGALRAADLKLVLLDDVDTMMTRRFDKDHIYAVLGDVMAEAGGHQVIMLHSLMHEDVPKAVSLFTRAPVTKVLVQRQSTSESGGAPPVTVTSPAPVTSPVAQDGVDKLAEKMNQLSLPPENTAAQTSLPEAVAQCVVEGY